MGRVLLQNFAGIFSSPNSIGATPEGAMLEAFNVIVREAGRLQPRRGFTTPVISASGGIADYDRGFAYGRGTFKHVLNVRNGSGPTLVGLFDEVAQTVVTLPQNPGANG